MRVVSCRVGNVVSRFHWKIEKEEEKVGQHDPGKQQFHLCIVNLVIGTLYCAKVRIYFSADGWAGRTVR